VVADLAHLARASRLGAELDLEALPRPAGLARAAARLAVDPLDLVLHGGEDYELLFSARGPGASAAALARRLGVPVTRIGRLTRRGGLRDARSGRRLRAEGFRHF
jgi:thiamine-monophosphate kinase